MMKARGARSARVLLFMALLIPIGPLMAICGSMYFSGNSYALGAVMLLASGGLLYIVFQDIAPQSRLDKHWFPPLGAVLGFSVGLLGNLLIG
jgi:zinc transporter, ZIP family